MSISVFVTYCWESEEHDNKVLQLTNHLRQKGFNAEMDKLKSQNETAVDFVKMMNEAMTSYDKVIVVLSENYKSKAEVFKGGVGMEYNLIIKDISDNPNKYILISFQGISNNIVPLSLKGRDIVDLQKGDSEFNKLYSKLMGVSPIKFAEVSGSLPQVEQKDIPDFNLDNQTKGIEFQKVREEFMGDSQQFGQYKSCHRKIRFEMKNHSGKTLDGCQIELTINPNFLYGNFVSHGPQNNLNTTISTKIFSNQTVLTDPIEIQVTDHNSVQAGKTNISVKIFSEVGETTFEVPLLDCITIDRNYQKRRVELDDFLKPF